MSAESIEPPSAIRPAASPLSHHPSTESLAAYALGDCSPGTALLIVQHIALCPKCAGAVQSMGASAPAAWVAPAGDDWRTLCPGVEISPVRDVSGLGELVVQIRADPGARLPGSMARRMDELVILAGGFTHQGHAASVGDLWAPGLDQQRELVANKEAGFYGLFTTSDEAWDDELNA
ncbi:zf-HC2 domain-containing protein [Phenylobacterium deserti]|uniref:Putative zinc-finger domain-containing protein n=1 Tax=Phenylobacterium deserti TaxID=1914756 RepID=A0A328AVD9_9CAUL|nr:zf-HC2 domain-containing protein [Phenylobacterium deserti]RAK58131.1 hypothetical protein DJ018_09560 [Phenylobacterium deserti]